MLAMRYAFDALGSWGARRSRFYRVVMFGGFGSVEAEHHHRAYRRYAGVCSWRRCPMCNGSS
jgi:hypothetical protein